MKPATIVSIPCIVLLTVLLSINLHGAEGRKTGTCPKLPVPPLANVHDNCHRDEDCRGRQICCRTISGRTCMHPAEMRASRIRGFCPTYFGSRKLNAIDHCNRDDECPEDRLCCDTIAGFTCMKPETKANPRYELVCPELSGQIEKDAVDRCQSDDECSWGNICCDTITGTACMQPKSTMPTIKDGHCPRVSSKPSEEAKDRCSDDDDCQEDWKCCLTIRGKMCLKPVDP